MSVLPKACRGLLCGAALVVLPAPALAQTATTTYDDNTVTREVEREDNDFPWGLLGLLGLAGLLGGRKKRDDARDIHVDARRDNRP
jgi:hypothetical protein